MGKIAQVTLRVRELIIGERNEELSGKSRLLQETIIHVCVCVIYKIPIVTWYSEKPSGQGDVSLLSTPPMAQLVTSISVLVTISCHINIFFFKWTGHETVANPLKNCTHQEDTHWPQIYVTTSRVGPHYFSSHWMRGKRFIISRVHCWGRLGGGRKLGTLNGAFRGIHIKYFERATSPLSGVPLTSSAGGASITVPGSQSVFVFCISIVKWKVISNLLLLDFWPV